MKKDKPLKEPWMTELQFRLAVLDHFLTEERWHDVIHTARNAEASIESLVTGTGDKAYYLSDGGYSRVCVSRLDDNFPLFLTSNSRDEVKARWEIAQELRDSVTQEIHRLLRLEGWMD